MDHFSTRRKRNDEQVKAWHKEGLFAGVPHARLYEMAALETRNLDRIRSLPSFQSIATPSSVNWLIERVSEEEGRPFTAGQKAEVFNELTGERGVTLTLGDPGTAKTMTLKSIERFNEKVLRPYGE